MPIEYSKFLWDIVSYITSLQAFFDFAIGCGIPNHMVRKAIEDNDPSDDDISLDNCVVQALTTWWTSNNTPTENKGPQGVKMGTKCLGKGRNSKTTIIQSNCSSMQPLNTIRENGEESDMEEQMPELLDLSDDEINTGTGTNQQGTTTETENNNGNENGNSRHTHTIVLMNVKNLQK